MSKNDSKLGSEYQYDKVPTDETTKQIDEEVPVHTGWGVRHYQVVILFSTLCVAFITRGHYGVTVVAMTKVPTIKDTEFPTNLTYSLDSNTTQDTNLINVTSTDQTDDPFSVYRTYHWTKTIQEMTLSGFFLGYCIMMFPMGLVAQRYGGKLPLQIALLINAVLSILAPWLALWGGWKAVVAVRVLQGMSQAGCFPSAHAFLSRWAPPAERATLASVTFSGAICGTIIAMQLGGLLAHSSWGWPAAFWASGALCAAMLAVLTAFGAASPHDHRTISPLERNYILGKADDGNHAVAPTPWRAILTSRAAWAAFVGQVGSGVSFIYFLTQVPSYLAYILKVNLKNSGLLSSLPYAVSLVSGAASGPLSDLLTNRRLLSLPAARKLFNSLSQVGPALCFAALSYTRDLTLAMLWLTTLLALHCFMYNGWMINYIDLSPRFAGALMATGNTLTNTVNMALPLLTSFILTDVYDQLQWRTMFLVMSGMCVACNLMFVVFMSADTQPWDDPAYQRQPDGEKDQKKC